MVRLNLHDLLFFFFFPTSHNFPNLFDLTSYQLCPHSKYMSQSPFACSYLCLKCSSYRYPIIHIISLSLNILTLRSSLTSLLTFITTSIFILLLCLLISNWYNIKFICLLIICCLPLKCILH